LGQTKTIRQKPRLETKEENEIMVKKEFACDQCGRKMEAYPPDDSYTTFFIKSCCEKSIERKYECDDCNFRNVRYWCVRHTVIVSASYDIDRELDRTYSF